VLHSFFLPNLRIKQDVVPGMTQFTWFRANKAGVYDIVCAELCGWGHYKMRGRLTIEPEEQFNKWLTQKFEEQEFSGSAENSGE
jgi:cytochrome c oxidase subunit 2